jgi:hypothetical protein
MCLLVCCFPTPPPASSFTRHLESVIPQTASGSMKVKLPFPGSAFRAVKTHPIRLTLLGQSIDEVFTPFQRPMPPIWYYGSEKSWVTKPYPARRRQRRRCSSDWPCVSQAKILNPLQVVRSGQEAVAYLSGWGKGAEVAVGSGWTNPLLPRANQ